MQVAVGHIDGLSFGQKMFNGDADSSFDVFSSTPELPLGRTSSKRTARGEKRVNSSSNAESELKRSRIDPSVKTQAVQVSVTDEFDQEAARKVAPTKDNASDQPLVLKHQVRHQVALPPNYAYIPISQHQKPEFPAKSYPFTLDPFQATAIASIERNESVLVSAHTSAGKTVVAEYAIAQSLKNKQRVIYTSPIKALSNQKYRELLEEFQDVGLMTGDVTINPTASCLVMTTEILRSMLYRGSEVMREVAWVIFDEIHYMRDKERGVVWEETIILLPDKVHYVFLSATIPNAMQFAEWIVKTHSQPCHVVYTDFRPTPLQHYLFPASGDGIHLVVDEKSQFREDNFQKAMGALVENMGDDPAALPSKKAGKKGKTAKGGVKGPSDIYKIVKMIMVKNYNPVIVFSFSKRECENLALQMSKLDMCDDVERDNVSKIFTNAMNSLSETDRKLPQIEHILPLLRRGIGIHHSGLLPILKEVIEILFQEGLIKVLFATETFSIGLNMPAKTVVFTNVRKFDGKEFRWVSSGEYIQMSGRAGRRGLDDRGIVILMIDEKMEPPVAKNMLKGAADRLDSAFHLSYNMILNLMRVEGISPEFMLERCFFQFQSNSAVPELEADLTRMLAQVDDSAVEDEQTIGEYYDLKRQLDSYAQDMRDIINNPNYCLPFMQPGRLVKVKNGESDFGWGAIVSYSKRIPPKGTTSDYLPQESYIIDVLLWVAKESSKSHKKGVEDDMRPAAIAEEGKMEVVSVILSALNGIGHIRIFLPKDIKNVEQRNTVRKSMLEVQKRFPDGIALLDPVDNMHINDDSFKQLIRKVEVLEARLISNPLHNSPRLTDLYERYSKKMELQNSIKDTRSKISAAHSIMQLDELKCRKRVLRRLGFTTAEDVIEMKGRVACEISSGDELLLTEMIFNGVFNDLSPEQCAALLSCCVFQEKSEDVPKLKDELGGPLKIMQETARKIAKVSQESKLNLVEEEYVQSFKPALMDVVYAWAQGKSFAHICKMTDVYEGSLIRAFRRLEELLRQMVSAYDAIGNEEMSKKMEAAIKTLTRDIIFSSSLYL